MRLAPTPLKRHHRARSRCAIILPLTLLILGSFGCSREELTQAMDDAKAKTKSLTESAVAVVEEKLPEAGSAILQLPQSGSARLDMNPPAEMKQADVEIITIGDGRPNVVQIATYDTSSELKTYPALLLHGTTTATDAAALAGSSIECDMYFQAAQLDPIAMTKPGGSVKVTFGSINPENGALPATLAMAELVGPDNTERVVRGGELVLVMREKN